MSKLKQHVFHIIGLCPEQQKQYDVDCRSEPPFFSTFQLGPQKEPTDIL